MTGVTRPQEDELLLALVPFQHKDQGAAQAADGYCTHDKREVGPHTVCSETCDSPDTFTRGKFLEGC